MQIRTLLPVAAVAATLLAGCSGEVSVGGDDQVSAEDVEQDIRGAYEAQTDIDMKRLTCESAEAEVGARIDCDGRNARDVALTIRGEITAVNDDGVDYNWKVVKAVAPGELFAGEVGRLLEQKYGPVVADVSCPDRIEVRKGAEVTCDAQARNGDTGKAVLVLTDGDGAFSIKSFDTAGASGGEGA